MDRERRKKKEEGKRHPECGMEGWARGEVERQRSDGRDGRVDLE